LKVSVFVILKRRAPVILSAAKNLESNRARRGKILRSAQDDRVKILHSFTVTTTGFCHYGMLKLSLLIISTIFLKTKPSFIVVRHHKMDINPTSGIMALEKRERKML
jgi:hypothetical protein